MKKILSIFIFAICLVSVFEVCYAKAEVVSTAVADGNKVTIEGQVLNSDGNNEIAVLVGSPENIAYINQTTSDGNGNFRFDFMLPYTLEYGIYQLKIGTNAGTEVYTGNIVYKKKAEPITNSFFNADLTVRIENYVPYIEGTINCTAGKNVNVYIVNSTDSTVVAKETIKGEGNEVLYQLPSLLNNKIYNVVISCSHGPEKLMNLNAEIDSAILTVDMTGEVEVAEGIRVDATLKSNNSDLINKSTTVTADKSISVTIPNIVANASYDLDVQGYETLVPVKSYECLVTGIANEEFEIAAAGSSIASFDDKVFALTYDTSQVEAVSFFADETTDILSVGTKNNVNIMEYQPGEIKFSIVDTTVPTGELWSGVLNVFKFRFKDNYSGNASIIISEENY